jgi:hypothetical protein
MKRLILPLALISAGLGSPAAQALPSECFAKPSAVFAAHPNASHASYSLRVKKGERCWYADAFRTDTREQPRQVAMAIPESAPREAMTAPAPQPRTTAAAPASQPRTTAIAPAPQSRTTAIVPVPQPRIAAVAPAVQPRTRAITPALQPFVIEVPSHNPRVSQIARGMNWISPADESPTDFEGRFSVTGYSVTGYRVPK